jgi:hypothetical protein
MTKLARTHPATALFGVLTEALAGQFSPYAKRWSNPAKATAPATGSGRDDRQNWMARAGERLFRHQLLGTRHYLSGSEGIFMDLDHWLWKQQHRETEAWLAQSRDVYELEARMRELERGRGRNVL